MICDVCNLEAERLLSASIAGQFVSDRCDSCMEQQRSQQPISSTNQDYRIRRQQEDHRADTLQPYIDGKPNIDFARVYKDKTKDYFTKEQLHKAERE